MALKSETTMKILLVVLGILLLVGLMFGGKFVSVRNELATQNEAIAGAWAQVDVALQRRADLIPNLVSTVKGFATHEQQVIDSVTAARAALGGARNPQDELAGTENRIAVERRKYNEVVQRYNTQIALFPNNLIASMSGFQRNDAYFKTEPGSRVAPKVAF